MYTTFKIESISTRNKSRIIIYQFVLDALIIWIFIASKLKKGIFIKDFTEYINRIIIAH
jgi:hypothetical protein